jgi:cysteine-rich repeat protein
MGWLAITAAALAAQASASPPVERTGRHLDDKRAGSAGRFDVVAGTISYEFDPAVLAALGWEVLIRPEVDDFATATSLTSAVGGTSSLDMSPADGGGAVRRAVIRSRGAILLHAGGFRSVLSNPVLVLDSRDGPARLAVHSASDADLSTPFFLVTDGHIHFDPMDAVDGGLWAGRLRAAGELIVSDTLARGHGLPGATGTVIGRVSVSVRLGRGEARGPAEAVLPLGDVPGGAAMLIGPDVIVGTLDEIRKYGVSSGIVGFSVGTVSCNVGDAPLAWHSNTNEHPVIGQNMFRLEDGRFEQIGMSWLKHGFYAVSGSLCYSDCQATDGTALGVHCSDPYSASLNGAQSNLGPRSQVNAFTGYFPYPPSSPAYPAVIGRRLQVLVSDLDQAVHPQAQYFVEGQYVTADDAAAGNQNNNASYRPASVQGTGDAVTAQVTGTTRRRDPGIRAWQDNETGVVETNVQVPDEGLFILAAKATDLGGGLWAYEYALQNLTSDRSAGSFRVPIEEDALVSAIGFHDVPYHSGEPYDGTDWTSTRSSVGVTWSTSTYAQDPLANALRWGTLYNFRFEADAPPQPTSVRIGLFKPGSPEWVDAATIGPITNAEDCNNNDVADSLDIATGSSQDCNGNAVPDECEVYQPAAELAATGLVSPVYVTGAPGSGALADRLFVVEQAGRIKVLSGGVVLPTTFLNISSQVLSGGERGLLSVAFHPDYESNGHFFVNYTDLGGSTVLARYTVSADPNVADAGSQVILKTIAQPFATHNGGQLQFGPDGYLYVGMGDGGGAYDPGNRAQDTGTLLGKMLRLDVDNPPAYIPPDNPYLETTLPLDEIWGLGLRNPWRFSFDRLTGELYIADVGQAAWEEVSVQPAESTGGENYGWRCMEGFACTGQSGCTCNSPALTLPTYVYANGGDDCAIIGGYVYRGCAMPNVRGTYFFADLCSGAIRSFRYENGTVGELMDRTGQLTPPAGPITSIASFGEGTDGELYIVSRGGQIYKIVPNADVCGNGVVEGAETCDDGNFDPGDGCDALCQIEPGANDACEDALFVGDGLFAFDSGGANTDGPAEPALCSAGGDPQVGADLWYCYEAPCTGLATAALCNSAFDTKLAVYDGCTCPSGESATACNDDACGSASIVTFPVSACDTYLIRVGGFEGATGEGLLNLSCDPDEISVDCNGNGIDDAADIVCGDSTDGNSNGVPDECESPGDRYLGGRLYDNWWDEEAAPAPTTDHPLWTYRPDPFSNPATGAATWRCKECHGWDYQGVSGQYASGPHRTGFPGILGTTLSSAELFALLREPLSNGGGPGVLNGHDYGSALSDVRINDLVAFVLSGVINDDTYVDPGSGDFLGDPDFGLVEYNSGGSPACVACHGADGTGINFGTYNEPQYVGTVAVENPWELLHKIRFGQPGAPMPSWNAQGGTTGEAAAIGRYAQLYLPTECVEDGQCDDGMDCTQNVCNAEGRCTFVPDDSACPSDGLACNGPEVCDADLGCVPAGPPCLGPCAEPDGCVCEPPVAVAAGGRYLSITPQPPGGAYPMRIRVTPVCELGTPVYLDVPGGAYYLADTVESRDSGALLTPAEWDGPVYITGLEIVPSQLYVVHADCGNAIGPALSTAVAVTTPRWGDTGSPGGAGHEGPFDGLVNYQDINSMVQAYKHIPTAPPVYATDLAGCVPNQWIDFIDIGSTVDGYKNRDYATYSRCPGPCW